MIVSHVEIAFCVPRTLHSVLHYVDLVVMANVHHPSYMIRCVCRAKQDSILESVCAEALPCHLFVAATALACSSYRTRTHHCQLHGIDCILITDWHEKRLCSQSGP